MSNDLEDLRGHRKKIFFLLLLRLRQLHDERAPPTAYYVGQEYVEDPDLVHCELVAVFLSPGQINPFEFWYHGTRVFVDQIGGALVVTARRRISSQLWDDLRLKGIGYQFIVGYLNAIMPAINRSLIDYRYKTGHLLARTFALFEAVELGVVVAGRALQIPWPPSLPAFPPTLSYAGIQTPLYVRDYIDAIGAYFRYEYDDSIRRVITATENFLDTHAWKAAPRVEPQIIKWIKIVIGWPKQKTGSFRRRLADNLDKGTISGDVINQNLQHTYTVRNKIVHSGFRLSTRSAIFCDKAVCTLYYLIYRNCQNQQLSDYMMTLHQQFILQKDLLGQMIDLDKIASWKLCRNEANIVNSDADLENFMFEGLRIGDDYKQHL